VLLGHWRRIGWAGAATEEMREAARKALATVGLDGLDTLLMARECHSHRE